MNDFKYIRISKIRPGAVFEYNRYYQYMTIYSGNKLLSEYHLWLGLFLDEELAPVFLKYWTRVSSQCDGYSGLYPPIMWL